MSAPINDGGPAFPSGNDIVVGDWHTKGHPGLSMRDWFAGQALAGMLSDPNFNPTGPEAARKAFMFADAMLAARSANKEAKP